MKHTTIGAIAMLIISLNVHAQQTQSILDGKKFSIEMMKDGALDSKETLVFEKGSMDPLQCHQYGFTAAAYQAKNTAEAYTFKVITKSEKEGTMAWQGKITGDKIVGMVTWTKAGQDAIHYTFKGIAQDK